MPNERMKRRTAEVLEGSCTRLLKTLPDHSIDAVITDPPYPEINRSYGRWTEDEWWLLMMKVCKQVRRVLKPTGSAVFILQPNSRIRGSMRPWLFKFLLWVCEEWNLIQDVWWWNFTALPGDLAGLLRPSLRACVWAGSPDCYRNRLDVLLVESESNRNARKRGRIPEGKTDRPCGWQIDNRNMRNVAVQNGGTTPFNVLPISNNGSYDAAGSNGHPAGTPMKLARWWVKYICPPEGMVLDPFCGSGTMALAALKEGRNAIGMERMPEYVTIARARIAKYQRNRGIVY